VLDGIRSDECPSVLRADVRPDDNCKEALFGTVQEVAEEVSVLVPAAYLCGGSLPRAICSKAEVDDEAVSPRGIVGYSLFPTK
jgi:hypothetical protein